MWIIIIYVGKLDIIDTMNAVYGKDHGYYLVVRGVENMEELKNE